MCSLHRRDYEASDVSDDEFSACPSLKTGTEVPSHSAQSNTTGVLNKRFMIPASEVHALLRERGIDSSDQHAVHTFLMSLVQPAACLARAPVSSFHVGAVGLGLSGSIYVGVNIELPENHLNNSIHAEQFLLLNCLQHRERGLRALAVSAAPCGHCRQFMVETTTADQARIVFGAEEYQDQGQSAPSSSGHEASNGAASHHQSKRYNSYSLNDLLPLKFGPMDLMSDGKAFPLLLAQQQHLVHVSQRSIQGLSKKRGGISELLGRGISVAEQWAQQCYAPYTGCASGVAILTSAGKVYGGGYVESAAFNPSLTPFHAAWAAAVTDHVTADQVQEVILVELPSAPVGQKSGVRALTHSVAPHAVFTQLYLKHHKGGDAAAN